MDINNKKTNKDHLVDKENENLKKTSEVEDADEKDQKIAELTDQLKRAVADYRNLERRSFEEKMEAVKYGNKNLIDALLPALDTLILAGKYTTDDNIKLTLQKVLEVLKENGIEKVPTIDAKYNADTMEALEVVEGKEGQVVEEVRPGFTLNGRLIRPAQVKVGNKK